MSIIGLTPLPLLAPGSNSSTKIVTLLASSVSVVLPARSSDLILKSTLPVKPSAVGQPVIASKWVAVIVIDTLSAPVD